MLPKESKNQEGEGCHFQFAAKDLWALSSTVASGADTGLSFATHMPVARCLLKPERPTLEPPLSADSIFAMIPNQTGIASGWRRPLLMTPFPYAVHGRLHHVPS